MITEDRGNLAETVTEVFSPLAATNDTQHQEQQKKQQYTENDNNVPKGEVEADCPAGNSSVASARFNFVNSIVGSGIIGIPYAIQECGLVIGVGMLILVAYLIYKSVV